MFKDNSILSQLENSPNSPEDHNDYRRHPQRSPFKSLPLWLQPPTAMKSELWPLTCSGFGAKIPLCYLFSICMNKILCYESTGARGRLNIHVIEHHWGESSTWLWRARQPQRYIQEEPFDFSHQRNARAQCQTTAATPEMLGGGAEGWLCEVTH